MGERTGFEKLSGENVNSAERDARTVLTGEVIAARQPGVNRLATVPCQYLTGAGPLLEQASSLRDYVIRSDAWCSQIADMSSTHKESARKLEEFTSRNFSKIDDNGDKFISQAELKLYLLRDDLTEEDKRLGKLLLTNFDDIIQLTDTGKWRDLVQSRSLKSMLGEERDYKPPVKAKEELAQSDLKFLVDATNGVFFQDELKKGSWSLSKADYFLGTYMGSLPGGMMGGLLAYNFAVDRLPPKYRFLVGAAGALAGLGLGIAGGYAVGRVREELVWKPAVQDYYQHKREITSRILDQMK